MIFSFRSRIFTQLFNQITRYAVNHLRWLHVLTPTAPLFALFFMYSSPRPPSLLSQRRGRLLNYILFIIQLSSPQLFPQELFRISLVGSLLLCMFLYFLKIKFFKIFHFK